MGDIWCAQRCRKIGIVQAAEHQYDRVNSYAPKATDSPASTGDLQLTHHAATVD